MSGKLDLKLPLDALGNIKLIVVEGVNKGKRYRLGGKKITLGRAKGNDIEFISTGVSKSHAKIEVTGGAVVIKDLESSNGTFINGKRISTAILSPGDKISLGTACDIIIEGTFESAPKLDSIEETLGAPAPSATLANLIQEAKHIDNVSPKTSLKTEPLEPQEQKTQNSQKKILLYVILIAALGSFALFYDKLMPTTKETPLPQKKLIDTVSTVNPYNKTPPIENRLEPLRQDNVFESKFSKDADELFKKAFNTYLSNRFNDSINMFNEVLMFDKDHALAKLYLQRAQGELRELVDIHDKHGRELFENLKYDEAIVEFRKVVNLLGSNPLDPRFNESKKYIKESEKRLKR